MIKKTPKYTFNIWGALALFMGGGLSSIALVLPIAFLYHDIQNNQYFTILSTVIMWAGAIFSFDYFICRKQTGSPLKFNLEMPNISAILFLFLLMGTVLASEFFIDSIPTEGEFWGYMYQKYMEIMQLINLQPASILILAVIIAPIFEEIVFRGIVLKGLTNAGVSPWRAIIISSLLFGIIHANPWQFVGASIIGVVLGYSYIKSGTIMLPIGLHAINNGLVLCLYFYTGKEKFSEILGVQNYILLIVGIIIAALAVMKIKQIK